jgi:hypothetical protein
MMKPEARVDATEPDMRLQNRTTLIELILVNSWDFEYKSCEVLLSLVRVLKSEA